MVFGYIRVSTDRQTTDNQRYEILRYASDRKIQIDEWVEEIVTTRKKLEERRLSDLLATVKRNDTIIVSELSRFGRSTTEVMSLLHDCILKGISIVSIKENFELSDNINSKVIAFAFSLSAEIERQLISQRTKEALHKIKSEGSALGRPKGSRNKETKLSGKEDEIKELLSKRVPITVISRIYGVNRLTVKRFIESRLS